MTELREGRPPAGTPRPYHFPAFTKRGFPNGLTLWIVPLPDREMVSAHLLVDGGAAAETEPVGGVAALTAEVLVTGTRRLDANAFAEETEREGIEVSADSSWDSARASFQALAIKLERGFALLAEMVLEPRFDKGEFERLRGERLADILQARSEPGRLADELFLRNCYAPTSPYARLSAGTPDTVETLVAEQAKGHHATHWRPDRAHLVVAGPVDEEAVARLVEAHFGAW